MTDDGYSELVIVMGDLNSPFNEDGYKVLTGHRYAGTESATASAQLSMPDPKSITFVDARHALLRRPPIGVSSAAPASNSCGLRAPFGEHFTYTGFSSTSPRALIDYILIADNGLIKGEERDKAPWRVARYGVIPNHFGDGMWVSDHQLVVVTLQKVRTILYDAYS